MAFAELGFSVEAVCPANHPLLRTRAVAKTHRYSALHPVASVGDIIAKVRPAFLVPCDDRAVQHLHLLHRVTVARHPTIADVIDRSLGDPAGYGCADRRADLIATARAAGIRAPDMIRIESTEDLRAAIGQIGLPAVMKADGTWGGLGVEIVHTVPAAIDAWHKLSRPVGPARMIKRWAVDRDPFSIRPCVDSERPTVNIQRYVAGQPANGSFACWQGEILTGINVLALRTRGARGNSTVVEAISNPEMTRAGQKLIGALGASGFCGLDFVLEDGTGHAHLIEMNPRATPITHLALTGGRDPVSALAGRIWGPIDRIARRPIKSDVIAFFPQAWLLEPGSPHLLGSFHDVPWSEPDLVRELLLPPWPERQYLARLLARWRRSGRSQAALAAVEALPARAPAQLKSAP